MRRRLIDGITLLRARGLRAGTTDAEQKLWRALRSRQFERFKFRRQFPIGKLIADFCCIEFKLVVELDGAQHLESTAKDEFRTRLLGDSGFRVLRFWNDDVLTGIDDVLEVIRRELDSRA